MFLVIFSYLEGLFKIYTNIENIDNKLPHFPIIKVIKITIYLFHAAWEVLVHHERVDGCM